jgi:hypothetical protein
MQRLLRIAAAGLLLGFAASVHAEPILMILEHAENKQPVQTKVEAKAGQTESPLRGKALEKLRINPGDAFSGGPQPGDITVELSRGTGGETSPICAVTVRYFKDKNGVWVPHYQLVEEAMVARGPDGRFRPLTIARGMPLLLVMTGTALPNPEGFFPWIEFGLTHGTMQIDSWTIKSN